MQMLDSESLEIVYDNIERPAHYTEGRRYEPMDVIDDWDLHRWLAHVVEYVARAGRKGDELEDLRKARMYLSRRIGQLEAGLDDAATAR